MSGYKPDETKTHLMYLIEASKNSSHEKCYDEFSGKVHSKEEVDELIASLKKLGYRLQVRRVSTTYVIDEELPDEEQE